MSNRTRPGDALRLLLRQNDISQETLASSIGMSRLTVNLIINNHRGVTPEVALRIGHATNTEPLEWLLLQHRSDLRIARAKIAGELRSLPILIRRRQRVGFS